ncbi:MAG: efflux RND transporter permease subunit, partial [Candidatus Theseobacter exili]|nr:efflux RND transporter permease subunit [Candidatus Theseobacter exili]
MTETSDSALFKGAIGWMANNPVAANLIMIVLLCGGLITAYTIKQEVFPDFEIDSVSVTVPYPGASPEEVEQGIILVIEEAVRGLDGVDEINSIAGEGVGSVVIDLLLSANRQKVYQDIQQEVDRITTFPEETEKPRITLLSRKRRVITLAIHGSLSENVLREMAEQIRDTLLQNKNITQIELSGIRSKEISISVSKNKLRKYGLTLGELANIVKRNALEIPGGGIKTASGEILVRVKDRRDYGSEFAQIPVISTPEGTQVLLGDIAEIEDGFEDKDIYAEYQEEPAIMMDIHRVGKQT